MRPTMVRRLSGHRGPVYALAVRGDRVLSGSGDGMVAAWDANGAAGEAVAQVGQAVFALTVLDEPEALVIGTEGGELHVVDLRDRREVQHLVLHRRGIFRIAALGKDRVVCAGGDGTLSVWTVRRDAQGPRLALQRQIPITEEKLRDVAVHAAAGLVAVACGDGTVRVLDREDLNERLTLEAHTGGATSVAWHPGKPVLLSGGKDGHLRAWHTERGTPLLAQPAHRAGIYALAFDPRRLVLASASRDKTAKLWRAHDLEAEARLDRSSGGHTHSVNHLCWLGDRLFTGGDDRLVIEWSLSGSGADGR